VERVVCLDRRARLASRDRRGHLAFGFTVPPGSVELRLRFRYAPGEVGGVRNLLTLSVFDPRGFRGAAHRWRVDQEVVLTPGRATPGFLAGPLYAGRWEVGVDAHEVLNDGEGAGWCEWSLQAVAVRDPGRDAREADPRERPPGPVCLHSRAGWYRGDLHSHSLHCDGTAPVAAMARAARRAGLQFLAMTCRNTTSWLADLDGWPEGLLPIRGMELTTFRGHANLLGLAGWVDWRDPGPAGLARALREAVRRRALVVVNHPMAVGNPRCTGCTWEWEGVDPGLVHAVEVWNGPWGAGEVDNPGALALWTALLDRGLRVPAVAGTDAHDPADYEARGLGFTWVHAEGLGEAEVLEAVARGRSYLSRGPRLRLVLPDGREVVPGEELPPDRFEALQVEVRDLSAPATLRFVADGEPGPPGTSRPPGPGWPPAPPPGGGDGGSCGPGTGPTSSWRSPTPCTWRGAGEGGGGR
jgi:hypothetical protein